MTGCEGAVGAAVFPGGEVGAVVGITDAIGCGAIGGERTGGEVFVVSLISSAC